MVPMHSKKRKGAFHEPVVGTSRRDVPARVEAGGSIAPLRGRRSAVPTRFLVPMHGPKAEGAFHEFAENQDVALTRVLQCGAKERWCESASRVIETMTTEIPLSPAANPFLLRRAVCQDAPSLIELICALAHFERLTPPDSEEQARLIADGFGDRARYEAWLAFWQNETAPVGYAVFFETYSTFRATPTLYLEDIFVLPDYRRRGIGSALLRHCIQLAHDRGCARMEWTCLDWKRKAQQVYERIGARHLSEWYP